MTHPFVVVMYKGEKFSVDASQDLAYVIDDIWSWLTDTFPSMSDDESLDVADTLGIKAISRVGQ